MCNLLSSNLNLILLQFYKSHCLLKFSKMRNINSLRILIFIYFCFLSVSFHAQIISLTKTKYFYDKIGYELFVKDDFDGDSEYEFLTDANNKSVILIGNIENGNIETKYRSNLRTNFNKLVYEDTDFDGQKELFAITNDDFVYELSIPELEVIDTFKIELDYYEISDIIFSDHNQDGIYNWIVISEHKGSYILNANDFHVEKELNSEIEGDKIRIANFDDDPENEIFIYTHWKSYLLNSANYSIEKKFGDYYKDFEIINFDNDNKKEILFLGRDNLSLYDHKKNTIIDSVEVNNSFINNIFVGNIDDDTNDEIILYADSYNTFDMLLIDTNPFGKIKKVKSPFYKDIKIGKLLSFDDFFYKGNNNLLFFDKTFQSFDYKKGILLGQTNDFSFPEISIFDNLVSQSEKDIVLVSRSNSTGSDCEKLYFMNYDSFIVEKVLSPGFFMPDKINPQINSDVEKFKLKANKTYDIIVNGSYNEHLVFYDPEHNFKYNDDIFKSDYYFTDDYDYDGNYELYLWDSSKDIRCIEFENDSKYHNEFSILNNTWTNYVSVCKVDSNKYKKIVSVKLNKINIYDPVTSKTEEYPFEISSKLQELSSFISQKGSYSLYGLSKHNFFIFDLKDKGLTLNLDFSSNRTNSVKHIRIKSDDSFINYFILYGDKIILIDEEGNVIETSDSYPEYWATSTKMHIHDYDNDRKPEILTTYKYGILDFEFDLPGYFYQPFHLTYNFPQNNSISDIKTPILLNFNSEVNKSEILKNVKMYSDLTEDTIAFVVNKTQGFQYELKPMNDFIPNDKIVVTISNELKSNSNLYFDGNLNDYVELDSSDNYTFIFYTLKQNIINKPEIRWESNIVNSVYKDTKRLAKFSIVDNNPIKDIIKSCFHGFVEDFNNNTEQLALPVDSIFDSDKESFEILINAFGKNAGIYEYQIVADNYSNPEFDTLKFNIEILEENGVLFKRDGVNNLNTFAQKNDSVKSVFRLKWDRNFENANAFNNNRIVGEKDAIFLIKREQDSYNKDSLFLYKFNLSSGDVIWRNFIGYKAIAGDLVLDRGLLYFQYNDYVNYTPLLKCIDALTGEFVWESRFENQHVENLSPVVTDEYVVMAGGEYGGVYCFDRWTGKKLWYVKTKQETNWTPSVYENMVYAVGGGELKVINIETGAVEWQNDFKDYASFINESVIIDSINNSLIYKGEDSLYSLNIFSKELNWTYPIFYSNSNAVLYNNTVLFPDDKDFKIINAQNGVLIETVNDFPYYSQDIIASGGLLFMTLGNKSLNVFDAETLNSKWQYQDVFGVISIVDDNLIISNDNIFWVFKSTDDCFEMKDYSDTICFGEKFVISTFEYDQSGIYIDTIFKNDTCNEIFTLNLTVNNEIFLKDTLIGKDYGSGNGSIAVVPSGGSGNFAFNWNTGDTTQVVKNLSAGIYQVTITDMLGCSEVFSFKVEKANNLVESYLNNYMVYPNPAKKGESLYVLKEGDFCNIKYIEILNSLGQWQYDISLNKRNYFNIPFDLNNGIYFLKLKDKKKKIVGISKIFIF